MEQIKKTWEAFVDFVIGLTLSVGGSYLLKEGLHMLFVVSTAVLSTIAIHYTKLWLSKKRSK